MPEKVVNLSKCEQHYCCTLVVTQWLRHRSH